MHRGFSGWLSPLFGVKNTAFWRNQSTPSGIFPGRSDPNPEKLLNCLPSKPHQAFRQLNHGTLVTIADPPSRIKLVANSTMKPSTVIWCTRHGCSREEHKLLLLYQHSCTRSLSLINLVSGYDCRRGLSGGCRAGLTLERWLSSRLGLLVETRRRYGWLRMVFQGVRLFRVSI